MNRSAEEKRAAHADAVRRCRQQNSIRRVSLELPADVYELVARELAFRRTHGVPGASINAICCEALRHYWDDAGRQYRRDQAHANDPTAKATEERT